MRALEAAGILSPSASMNVGTAFPGLHPIHMSFPHTQMKIHLVLEFYQPPFYDTYKGQPQKIGLPCAVYRSDREHSPLQGFYKRSQENCGEMRWMKQAVSPGSQPFTLQNAVPGPAAFISQSRRDMQHPGEPEPTESRKVVLEMSFPRRDFTV